MNPQSWLKLQKHHSGKYLSLAVFLGLFNGLLLIIQAWFLAKTVNAVIFEQATLAELMPWLWLMLGLFLLRAVLAWASEQSAFRAAIQVKLALRKQLYQRIQQLGPAYLQGERSAELSNMLSEGIEALESYYAQFLPAISLMALVPLSILVVVFPFDWLSGLILLATAPLIPFFMILIGKGTEKRNQDQWQKMTRMSTHFLDVIQGMTQLKIFNASRREAHMVSQISEQFRTSTMSVLRLAFLSSFALEFFATVSLAVVAILIGFRLYWGEMDFFIGFFILLLAPEFYLPLRNMGTHYHAKMQGVAAAEKMLSIMQTDLPQQASETQNRFKLNAHKGIALQLKNIQFDYPDGRKALQGVNLQLCAGETVALIGKSGSGKTTLANLLLGFIQAQTGTLTANGVSINTIPMEEWRKQLAWVPQKARLFHGSVTDNIRMGNLSVDNESIIKAAQLAQADLFIQALPENYHTLIGEGGQNLSGGQQQRIILARAFLKKTPLLVLDEATANLDMESERCIQQAIKQLLKNRTVLMIAHRLQTLHLADRIAVMQNGRIVEFGSHQELMAQKGEYVKLLSHYKGQS